MADAVLADFWWHSLPCLTHTHTRVATPHCFVKGKTRIKGKSYSLAQVAENPWSSLDLQRQQWMAFPCMHTNKPCLPQQRAGGSTYIPALIWQILFQAFSGSCCFELLAIKPSSILWNQFSISVLQTPRWDWLGPCRSCKSHTHLTSR